MQERQILNLITSEYSWEQIIYKIVAWEGLDPWNIDIKALSNIFLQYVQKLREIDFKIPAKYLIIAAVLLRMKTDHLHFLEVVDGAEVPDIEEDIEQTGPSLRFEPSSVTMPPKRIARRRIMVNELVAALRRALKTQTKKKIKAVRAAGQIKISQVDLNERIQTLYERIINLLSKIKNEEIKFSSLIKKGHKEEIVSIFLPLIYLDNTKKVACRQEEIFDEIYIKKRV